LFAQEINTADMSPLPQQDEKKKKKVKAWKIWKKL
jgi:hypothetical protein